MTLRFGLFLLIALTLVACNRENFSAERNPDGGVDIRVTSTEAEVNTLLQNALANGEGKIRNAAIDLQAGQLVISGDVERENGTGEFVPASFTIALSVLDGGLSGQVLQANVADWAANDSRIMIINQNIEQALQGRALRDNPNINLLSITLTDTDLTFVLNAQKANEN
jgi:hypothetical protein